jgi:hypothetical protein
LAKITIPTMNEAEITQMQTTTGARMDSTLLGHDSDWWNVAMLISLGVAALVAVFVAAATTGVIIVQKREAVAAKDELDRYRLTVDGRIADARKEGIAAGEAAGGVLLKAAEANERAAKAELELAKYRSGRSITPEQHRILVERLKISAKGRVIVKPNFLNSEATRFANQISQVLIEAGFEGVGDVPLSIVSSNRPGLFLAVRDGSRAPLHTESILKAFAEAGISVESGYGDWVPDASTVVILVSEQP